MFASCPNPQEMQSNKLVLKVKTKSVDYFSHIWMDIKCSTQIIYDVIFSCHISFVHMSKIWRPSRNIKKASRNTQILANNTKNFDITALLSL